jgi:hypothetical protein
MGLTLIAVTGTYKDAAGNLLKAKRIKYTPVDVFGDGGIVVPPATSRVTTDPATAAFSSNLYTSDVAGAYVRYDVEFHDGSVKTFDLTDDAPSVALEDLINAYDGAQAASAAVTLLDHEARIDVLEAGGGGSETLTTLGALINSATSKTTPVDADMLPLMDSAASNITKKLSWANLKATAKTYFDTLYQPLASVLTNTTASFTTAQETKLAGMATGATANSSDATLLARANHTGAQLASTISDFNSAALSAAPAETTSTLGATISGAAAATPNNTDLVATVESSVVKKITWTNVKAFLKTYFDTLYSAIGSGISIGDPVTNGDTGSVLFVDSSGNIAEDTNLTFDAATKVLTANKVSVADAAYDATTWNDSLEVPTKNATRDEIEALRALIGGGGYSDEQAQDAVGGMVDGTLTYVDATPLLKVADGGINTTQLANDAVTNAKAANMAEATMKGRAAGAGTGDPQDLSPTQIRTLINVADGATANDTDANLKNRANHTGTQTASTISDFNSAALAAAPAETTTTIGSLINGATSKATPVDADQVGLMDSAASNVLKKLSWANIKATLKTYFDTLYPSGSGTSTGTNTGDQTSIVGISGTFSQFNTAVSDADLARSTLVGSPCEIGVAVSDETTNLSTGTAKATFRMPYAMTVTAVRASVNTAPTGSTLIVDINDGGTTIMATNKLSIDASEKTSTTAATAAGVTDTALADDAEITIDIDQVGSTIPGKGLKVWIIGTRA